MRSTGDSDSQRDAFARFQWLERVCEGVHRAGCWPKHRRPDGGFFDNALFIRGSVLLDLRTPLSLPSGILADCFTNRETKRGRATGRLGFPSPALPALATRDTHPINANDSVGDLKDLHHRVGRFDDDYFVDRGRS